VALQKPYLLTHYLPWFSFVRKLWPKLIVKIDHRELSEAGLNSVRRQVSHKNLDPILRSLHLHAYICTYIHTYIHTCIEFESIQRRRQKFLTPHSVIKLTYSKNKFYLWSVLQHFFYKKHSCTYVHMLQLAHKTLQRLRQEIATIYWMNKEIARGTVHLLF
jgi:hypothetical protein